MDFNEAQFEAYSEWAETDLLWGKGMFNWCRSYTKEEWEQPAFLKFDELDEEVMNNHPLCKFGG